MHNLNLYIKEYSNLSFWEIKQINYYLDTNFDKKSLDFFKPFIQYSTFIIIVYQKFIIGFINFINIRNFFELYCNTRPGYQFPIPIITLNGIFINNLFIQHKNRGKNLGTILVNSCIKYVKHNDLDHIICQVLDNNIKAKNLYLKLYFKIFMTGYDIMTKQKLNIFYRNI